ncbi:MAG TPA: RDD family protein [Candidatus Ruania gallistercoris]|uniref:RDD family protein n=1 Tax=Candidatus Ruania gallistercoris TaxID=2838746 RepID=A0A9D2J6P9_9MICO|nr:RDD family protein [Candidatus Ruania gallistercoris]
MSDVTQARGSEPSRDARESAEQFPGYWGRRILAICIDWALASAISAGFFGYDQMATLAAFGVMTFVLVGTAGTTIGHRIAGLGMRTLAGGLPGPVRGLARTVGVLLVIPVVVTDPAGRSLHDRWSGTQVVRL